MWIESSSDGHLRISKPDFHPGIRCNRLSRAHRSRIGRACKNALPDVGRIVKIASHDIELVEEIVDETVNLDLVVDLVGGRKINDSIARDLAGIGHTPENDCRAVAFIALKP